MNKLLSIANTIKNNPPLIYFFGTILGVLCIGIYTGVKIAALVLGVWAFIFMFAYACDKNGG